jgi:hypothetical protein
MLGGHWPKFYAIAAISFSAATPPRAGSAGLTITFFSGRRAPAQLAARARAVLDTPRIAPR